MTDNETLNAKYAGRFIVLRYSFTTHKFVRTSGKRYETIEEAVAASMRLDDGKRWLTSVDVIS